MQRKRRRHCITQRRNCEKPNRAQIERLEERLLLSVNRNGTSPPVTDTPLQLFFHRAAGPPAWALEAMRTPVADHVSSIDRALLTTQHTVQAQAPRQVVFVDRGIDDYTQLLHAIDIQQQSNADVGLDIVLLEKDQDGINQITDYLKSATNVGGIHILSHGSAGSLKLGNAWLDHQTLSEYSEELGQWRHALAHHADILLYGCNVAQGKWGISFVEEFAAATGADVAASTDLTGAERRGGDWQLEFAVGAVETGTVIDTNTLAGFQQVLVRQVPMNNVTANSTFTITGENVASQNTVGGGNPQNTPLGGLNESISINGSGFENTYKFNQEPNLPANELQASLLDGGDNIDGADPTKRTVDFGGYGANNTDLKFEIRATAEVGNADGTAGITAKRSDNTLIFQNIFRIKNLVGGKRKNTFTFYDSWDSDLNVNGRILNEGGNPNLPLFNGTLDFSNYTDSLEALVNANGQVTVTPDNANPKVVGTGIEKVAAAAGHTMTLDLSAISTELTITVEKVVANGNATNGTNTKVTIQAAAGNNNNPLRIPTIVFERIAELKLGTGNNRISFVNSAVLPTVMRGDVGTTVELDYSGYGVAAKVNKGGAVPNLGTAAASTLTTEAQNTWAWGQATWQMTSIDNAGNVSFTLDEENSLEKHQHQTIDLANAAAVGAGIKNLLDTLDGVVSNVASASLASPWTFTANAISSSLMAVGMAQASTGGSITLAANDARADNAYVGKKVTIATGTGAGQARTITAYDNVTKVATVDTNWNVNPDNTSNYRITDGDDGFPVLGSPNSVATYSRSGGGRVLTLASNATNGKFRLNFHADANAGVPIPTGDIVLDAARLDANEILNQINAVAPNAAASVTGHGTDFDPWVITLDGMHTFQNVPINIANLNGTAKVRIEQTVAPTPTILPRWNLENNETSGHFTVTYDDMVAGHAYTTKPLPADAPPELIEQALRTASDGNLLVRVTARTVPNVANAWAIEAVHKDFTLTAANRGNVRLTVQNAGGAMLANSATGIGTIAGTADTVTNLTIAKVTGSGTPTISSISLGRLTKLSRLQPVLATRRSSKAMLAAIPSQAPTRPLPVAMAAPIS